MRGAFAGRSRLWLALGALALACAFGAARSAAAIPPQQVQIVDFAFAPSNQTVEVGGAVEWVNQDGSKHTVTFNSLPIDSGDLDTAATFSATFATPGTYSYFCARHTFMTGTITVGAQQAPTPTTDPTPQPTAEPTPNPAPVPTLVPRVWQPIVLHQ